MPPADIGAYGEELYRQALPLHGPDPAGLAHDLVGAWALAAREIDDLARDSDAGPGWSVILDVDACPPKGLGWLAYLRGARLRPLGRIATLRNLHIDPDARNSVAGAWWQGSSAGLTNAHAGGGTLPEVSSAWTRRGFSSVRWRLVNPTATARSMVALMGGNSAGNRWPVTVGLRYVLLVSAYFAEVPPGHTGDVRLVFLNSAGVEVGAVAHSVAQGDASDHVLAMAAPAGAATAVGHLRASGQSNVAGDALEVFADSGLFVQLDTGTPDYFDPFVSDDSTFDGAANASTSTLYRDETLAEWAPDARERIRAQASAERGKPSAIASAVGEVLTGTKTVRLTERVDDSAYRIGLVTSPAETPDPAAVIPAALAQKPAGVRIMYAVQSDEPIIDEGPRTIDSVDPAVTIDAATVADVT